ncbi:methylated-DNA--[protein]-cysteine S-methyltransferase [Marinivivus vitaminiproducens]|uniref:methylated-DNA--[protein]-cysteine S-methyltransferase n=1 Tax=Marinivivus vitaminiproducens TaxID=3035935 RepID=UPI0027A22CA9|nr:methylated-DNA--[protein]-cysteine S-methyltransferase [Geminicoccaceae bacterium SCSIO 64248]
MPGDNDRLLDRDRLRQAVVVSSIGALRLVAEDDELVRIEWLRRPADGRASPTSPVLREAGAQLAAYFDGRLTRFDLPLRPQGSRYQRMVWAFIHDIPHGDTLTYGEIGKLTGSFARTVARTCGENPLPIVIPCHRVLAANGKTGGYSGGEGVRTKHDLLRLERVWL